MHAQRLPMSKAHPASYMHRMKDQEDTSRHVQWTVADGWQQAPNKQAKAAQGTPAATAGKNASHQEWLATSAAWHPLMLFLACYE